jgi:hypothetical protein
MPFIIATNCELVVIDKKKNNKIIGVPIQALLLDDKKIFIDDGVRYIKLRIPLGFMYMDGQYQNIRTCIGLSIPMTCVYDEFEIGFVFDYNFFESKVSPPTITILGSTEMYNINQRELAYNKDYLYTYSEFSPTIVRNTNDDHSMPKGHHTLAQWFNISYSKHSYGVYIRGNSIINRFELRYFETIIRSITHRDILHGKWSDVCRYTRVCVCISLKTAFLCLMRSGIGIDAVRLIINMVRQTEFCCSHLYWIPLSINTDNNNSSITHIDKSNNFDMQRLGSILHFNLFTLYVDMKKQPNDKRKCVISTAHSKQILFSNKGIFMRW